MLKPGWWVARTLHRDTAPLRSYVRKVQQVDERGMRITMIDLARWHCFRLRLLRPVAYVEGAEQLYRLSRQSCRHRVDGQ